MAHEFNTPPLPIQALTLSPRHHQAAWWWLGWLYRNPNAAERTMESMPRWRWMMHCLKLICHALPWVFLVSFLTRNLVTENLFGADEWLQTPRKERLLYYCELCLRNIAWGSLLGFIVGAFVSRSAAVIAVLLGLSSGVSGGLIQTSDVSLSSAIFEGICNGAAMGIFLSLTVDPISWRAPTAISAVAVIATLVFKLHPPQFVLEFPWFGGAIVSGGGTHYVIAFLLATWAFFLRIYYVPIHALFFCKRNDPNLYRYHPVAWEWRCPPLVRLDRLLLSYAEKDGAKIELQIHRLIRENPMQRAAAQRALTILRARQAARVERLSQLSNSVVDLPEGEKGFLAQTRRLRELIEGISRQQLRVDVTERPYFREVELRNLVMLIKSFQIQVSGMKEPLSAEFGKAAENWLDRAERQHEGATQAAKEEPAPQVFRAGDPVKSSVEAFVPRLRVLEEVQAEVMLGSGCPGILLSGPRRMGKSSLLRNVSGFLPGEVGVAVVSLQSARLFSSLGHFVSGLSDAIREAVSPSVGVGGALGREEHIPPTDLPGLAAFLDACNASLETVGRRVLVALDEYEMIDEKLREGVFTKDLLATIRESIQSHRRIIWAFSGNADITELTGADWTSYLISVRTLEVPVFTPEETHLLLTEPLKHSALREEDKAKSALFWREFWGEEGIARIHAEAGGWPYFLQLIAETAVTLANESSLSRRPLPAALLEQALDASVERGRNAFHQLLRAQSQVPGEWEYLAAFAARETQPPPEDAAIRRSLERRRLLIAVNVESALRVPLMRRWLQREG